MQPSSLKELSANRLGEMNIKKCSKIFKPGNIPYDLLPLYIWTI